MAALVSGTSVLVAAEHSYAQSLAMTVPRARRNRLALNALLRRQHPANIVPNHNTPTLMLVALIMATRLPGASGEFIDGKPVYDYCRCIDQRPFDRRMAINVITATSIALQALPRRRRT